MEKKVAAKPEKFFKACVGVWFRVYGELVPPIEVEPGVFETAQPSFIGAETRHLKSLLKELRERAEAKFVVWTEDEATKRFELFLRRAYEDKWLSQNFMLRMISNCRTKIFNNQITKNNGTHRGTSATGAAGKPKSVGANQLLEKLRTDIDTGRKQTD